MISADQALQNKSEIFVICSKIKHRDQLIQGIGIDELSTYLTEKSQQKKVMTTDVFEIIETGVSRILIQILKTQSDITIRRKVTKIFINLALGGKREVQKMINCGIIETMGELLENHGDLTVVINCVWTLSNIALTDLEMRNNIIKRLPAVFKLLEKYIVNSNDVGITANNFRLQSEIVFFVSSMIKQENINAAHYMFHYSIGVELLAKCLKNFNFYMQVHFEFIDDKKVLNDKVGQYLLDIISSFCTVHDIELLHATQISMVMAAQ
jgi:hypothetical protein